MTLLIISYQHLVLGNMTYCQMSFVTTVIVIDDYRLKLQVGGPWIFWREILLRGVRGGCEKIYEGPLISYFIAFFHLVFLNVLRVYELPIPPYPWALSICFKESQSATCCVTAGQHIICISLLTLIASNMCYLITYISTHMQLFIKHFLSLCYVAFWVPNWIVRN